MLTIKEFCKDRLRTSKANADNLVNEDSALALVNKLRSPELVKLREDTLSILADCD